MCWIRQQKNKQKKTRTLNPNNKKKKKQTPTAIITHTWKFDREQREMAMKSRKDQNFTNKTTLPSSNHTSVEVAQAGGVKPKTLVCEMNKI